MFPSRFLAVPLLALAFSLPLSANAQIPMGSPLPMDPNVTVGELENGLRYYIRQNSQPENRAELRLVVNAGSVLGRHAARSCSPRRAHGVQWH